MADTDTSPISQLVTKMDLANADVILVPAFQLLLYLAYNKREGELSQFKKLLETLRAQKGEAKVEWSPNNAIFREALIRFEADNHAILETEKTQVERIIPREAAVNAEIEFQNVHLEKLQRYRSFAKRLTDTYIDQLKNQTRNDDQKRALEDYRSSLTKRVEGILPNIVAEARSPNEIIPRLSQYLAGIPAFEASLQNLSENAGPTAQAAVSEVATQTRELFLDPTTIVEQSVYAPVLDKSAFVRIYKTLSSENPTYSPQQITSEATKLTLLHQALNGVVDPELDTSRSDVFLTAFAKTGLQRFVAPIAAALPDKTKAVLSEIILSRSWEKAVDNLTKEVGGRIAIELTPLIQQGNSTMGSGSQRGVSSLQNVIGDTASFIFGSPTAEIATFLKLAHIKASDAGREKRQSQTQALEALTRVFPKSEAGVISQVALTESKFLLLTSLLFVHAPERFRVYYQHGTETAGHGLRFVFDLGSDFIFGKILKSGAVQAGATAVKKGAASFFSGFLTKLGLSATADVILAIVGTPIATAIKWAIQAAIWLGGYLWRPLASAVGKFFRGELGPLGPTIEALKQTTQGFFGGVSASQSRARWDDDLPKLLAWGAVIGVLLFMLPLSPFSNFTDMVRSAALITSLASGASAQEDQYFSASYGEFTNLGTFACFSNSGTGVGDSVPLDQNQQNKIASAVNNNPRLSLYNCPLRCDTNKINLTVHPYSNANDAVMGELLGQGNVVLWQNAFKKTDSIIAANLAHELAHQLSHVSNAFDEWYRGTTSQPSSYCGSLGTYPKGLVETESETFAETARLYIMNDSRLEKSCPRSIDFFNRLFSQCK